MRRGLASTGWASGAPLERSHSLQHLALHHPHVRQHRLLGGIGIAQRNGLGHLLMLRIALPQPVGGTLSCWTQVKPRIAPNLAKKRIKICGQAVTGGSRDCIVKIQIGACALLFGKRGGGSLNPPNVDRRGAHRRHTGQGWLENGTQFSDFDGVGAPYQCAGTPPQPPRGRHSGEFAALAQICQRAPELMPRDRELGSELSLCRELLPTRRALAQLGEERRIGVGGSGSRHSHGRHSPIQIPQASNPTDQIVNWLFRKSFSAALDSIAAIGLSL